MAAYFFDTSALIKRYARETGASWMVSLFRRAREHRFYAVRITRVEAIAALAHKHYLRGYDAVQFAAALEANNRRTSQMLTPLMLVTADDDLLAASRGEGLKTDNPNNH